jgi:acetyl/propionyl-CoA carboxylase alpha subunit
MRIYAEDPARDFQPTTGRVLVFDLPCGACPAAPSIRVSYSVGRSAYATSEIWDDGILDPVDTRNALAMAINASLNALIASPNYGVFRM